ncbi:MAG: hypothetical protein JWO28_249 [Hyphomicrobiales bacterium]|nr:hypothetical protein [Hyphomicrobiales bacterium]
MYESAKNAAISAKQIAKRLERQPTKDVVTIETIHIMLSWRAGKGNRLKAEPPMKFKTASEAKGRAERSVDKFAGVVAMTQIVDQDTGEVGENPKILFRAGRLPPDFD